MKDACSPKNQTQLSDGRINVSNCAKAFEFKWVPFVYFCFSFPLF